MSSDYTDMIHMPHHVSENHAQMPLSDRAAQFAPFQALTGYGSAIYETGRYTEPRIELADNAKSALNDKFVEILRDIDEMPAVRCRCFVQDKSKRGGTYQEVSGRVKKIDELRQLIYLADGRVLSMKNIYTVTREDIP